MAKAREGRNDPQARENPRKTGASSHEDESFETSVWGSLQQTIGNAAVGRLVRTRDRAASEEATPITAEAQQAIDSQSGRGRPLDASTRESAEQALGGDLSGVRLHTDAGADLLSQSLAAHGFTQGRDVFLARDRDPSTPAGIETLTHELTHVAEGPALSGAVQREGLGDAMQLGSAVVGGVLGGPLGLVGAGAGLIASSQASGNNNAQQNPQGAQQPQQNQAMLAMFDATIVGPTQEAQKLLGADPPDFQTANTKLQSASHGCAALIDSYTSQGRIDIANALRGPNNTLVSAQMAIAPKIGVDVTAGEIAGILVTALSNFSAARSQLQ